MRFLVAVAAYDAAGEPIWMYSHEEVFVGEEDAEKNAIQLCGKMVERVDEGRAAIIEQAGVDMPRVGREQADR